MHLIQALAGAALEARLNMDIKNAGHEKSPASGTLNYLLYLKKA